MTKNNWNLASKIISFGKKSPATITTCAGGVIAVVAAVATKKPQIIERYVKVLKQTAKVVGTAYAIYKATTTIADEHKHRSESTDDANEYARKRKADGDYYEQKRKADADLYERKAKVDAEFGNKGSNEEEVSETPEPVEEPESTASNPQWNDAFQEKYKLPVLPPIIDKIINICPQKVRPAMFFHLVCLFASYCFSKVRAEYLDKVLHAPNVQVAIEGTSGSGKEIFNTIRRTIFERRIDQDLSKLNAFVSAKETEENDKHYIIQTVDTSITNAKLLDVLQENNGVHCFFFESEVSAFTKSLNKKNGFNFDYLRKAFDNGDVSVCNMSKATKNGVFKLFLNYSVTGTQGDFESFISKRVEGGNSSRICWTMIPDDSNDQSLDRLSDEELTGIQDQIDKWSRTYCYTTDEQGNDTAAEECVIQLDYVNQVIKQWIGEQEAQSKQENNPARCQTCKRIGNIAFVYGMIAHMMWHEPKEHTVARNNVCDLVLYAANYCMERWLHKFGDVWNASHEKNIQAETVNTGSANGGSKTGKTDIDIDEQVIQLHIDKPGREHLGYPKIAEFMGWYDKNGKPDKQKVRRILKRHGYAK